MLSVHQTTTPNKLADEVSDALMYYLAWFHRLEAGDDAIKRLIRAATIVDHHHLYRPFDSEKYGQYLNEAARVKSETDPEKFYAVCYSKGANKWFCECRDWRNGRAQQILAPDNPNRPNTGAPHIPGQGIMCKHCMAVMLSYRLAGYKLKAL